MNKKPQFLLAAQVLSDVVDTRSGTKDGKDWEVSEQEVWVTLPNAPFPQKVTLRLKSSNDAYRPGDYLIDLADCLDVGRFGSLAIDDRKIQLKPAAAPAQKVG